MGLLDPIQDERYTPRYRFPIERKDDIEKNLSELSRLGQQPPAEENDE